MKRLRVTFNTIPTLGHSLTHEILVPDNIQLEDDFIKGRINEDLLECLTPDLKPLKVDHIILIVDLVNFGVSDLPK